MITSRPQDDQFKMPSMRLDGRVALIVDIMKPATLGFVIPGMADEYSITRQTASWLAITALTGTAVG